MSFRLHWIRMSDSLFLSKCGRFICSFWAGQWVSIVWDGVGWSFIGERPVDSLQEAKARCEHARWFGAIPKASA